MTHTPLILVVDDDGLLQKALADMLLKRGYAVATANNGEEGLKLALEKQPALILLDYQMPILDGMQTLERIRADERGKKIEVVFSTNTYDTTVINRALALGVHDYILKSDSSLEQIADLVGKYAPIQP